MAKLPPLLPLLFITATTAAPPSNCSTAAATTLAALLDCRTTAAHADQRFPLRKRVKALHDWRDPSFTYDATTSRKIHSMLGLSWKNNYNVVTENGHEWCVLQRFGWSCAGPRYARVLSETRPYNASGFQLDAFDNGTVLVADGNSFFAEKVAMLVCGLSLSDVDIWQLQKEWNGELFFSNSVLVHHRRKDVWLLLFDNDDSWQNHDSQPVVEFLLAAKMTPSIVVIGSTNRGMASYGGPFCTGCKDQHGEVKSKSYTNAFPHTRLVYDVGRGLPSNCSSKNYDCADSGPGPASVHHTCFPGPVARYAEDLAERINKAYK